MTLTEFLAERLAEDEAEAREAVAMRERIDFIQPPEVPDMSLMAWDDLSVPAVVVGPERVLAEVAAKREIMRRARRERGRFEQTGGKLGNPIEVTIAYEMAVRILAAVYSDHPDYDESWRP